MSAPKKPTVASNKAQNPAAGSNNNNKSSKQTPAGASAKTFYEKKMPKLKVELGRPSQFEVRMSDKDVQYDVLKLLFFDQNIRKEVLIHRPVGTHHLQKDDWVLSSVEEFSDLLRNEKDTRTVEKEILRKSAIFSTLAEDGILEFQDNVFFYEGVPISLGKEDIPNEAAELIHDKLEALKARTEYIHVRRAVVNKEVPFETMKGVHLDKPQVAVKSFRGLEKREVLLAWFKKSTDFQGESVKEPIAPKPSQTNAVLRDFLAKVHAPVKNESEATPTETAKSTATVVLQESKKLESPTDETQLVPESKGSKSTKGRGILSMTKSQKK